MLVRFSVANYLSFNDEQTLNMLATPLHDHPEHCVPIQGDARLMRCAVVYGANASGKSNLVKAIAFARDLATRGTRADEEIQVDPFALGKAGERGPSRFRFEVALADSVYDYGFAVDRKTVHEEWLFRRVEGKEQRLFERKVLPNQKSEFKFGDSVKVGKQAIQFLEVAASGIRPNQLFLAETRERSDDTMKQWSRPLSDFLKEGLHVIGPSSTHPNLLGDLQADADLRGFIGEYLRHVDTGVEGLCVTERPISFKKAMEALMISTAGEISFDLDESRQQVPLKSQRGEPLDLEEAMTDTDSGLGLKSVHRNAEGKVVEFDFAAESDGTKRLLDLLPALAEAQTKPCVFIVDELDRSLHPALSMHFLRSFLSRCASCRSQLICTTHDTHLLDQELLRRDEVWFTEKAQGQTRLYSLADFRERNDLRLEKGYLHGRFGAIPFLGDPSRLPGAPTKKEAAGDGTDQPQATTS